MGCGASVQAGIVVQPKHAGEVMVKGENDSRYNVIVIGAGFAGLGAAKEALNQGLTVKVIEARNRLGGRVESVDMGPYKVDMGASWIHGIGPGCGDSEEWQDKMNPIYTIV
jgi:phytoene dehydrogenase-like protein